MIELKNTLVCMAVLIGSLYFLCNIPTIQIVEAQNKATPIRIDGFALGTPVKRIETICKNRGKFLQKVHTKIPGKEIYKCYVPGNGVDAAFLKYSKKGPVYINIGTDGEKVTSLGYVYSNIEIYKVIRDIFRHRYKQHEMPEQYTDSGTPVISFNSPGKWMAYFRIQEHTCIIQIYDSKTILGL